MPSERYQIGERLLGRYEISKILRGGMGVVYICVDKIEDRFVALKTFNDKYLSSQKAVSYFINEADIWINLGYHANIVTADRLEIIHNKPYLVLECILDSMHNPTDLSHKFALEPLTLKKVLYYGMQVCLGLHYAQQKHPGIVHRDIKPSNILIGTIDITNTFDIIKIAEQHQFVDSNFEIPMLWYELAKVTDFGIAAIPEIAFEHTNASFEQTAANSKAFRPTSRLGTVDYMSPEQLRGDTIDLRSDIYSLGCVIFEMITIRNFSNSCRTVGRSESLAYLPSEISSALAGFLAQEADSRYANFYDAGMALEECYCTLFEELPMFLTSLLRHSGQTHFMPLPFREAAGSFQEVQLNHQLSNLSNVERADALIKLGKYQEAIIFLEAYIGSFNDNPIFNSMISYAYILKGNALHYLGLFEGARESYHKATSIDPNDNNGWYNLGEVLFNNLNEPLKAIESYEKSLELEPEDDMAWSSLGYVRYSLGEIPEAIECFDKALAINPQLIVALANKGAILLEEGEIEGALEYFDKILEIDSTYAGAWYNKGLIFEMMARSEAKACFERAQQLDPNLKTNL